VFKDELSEPEGVSRAHFGILPIDPESQDCTGGPLSLLVSMPARARGTGTTRGLVPDGFLSLFRGVVTVGVT